MVAREHPQVGHCLRDCKHLCTGRNGHGCGARAAQRAIGRKTFARHGHFARTDCERDTRSHHERPVTTMRTYVEAMAHAVYSSPRPSDSTLTVIAALGPKMLALARDFADGAHPYNTTVAQTAAARAVLGPNKLLCVEQKVLLETNAARAREIARAYLRPYLRLPTYVNSWRRAGFDDGDFADNGSNRLVGTLVAWGDEDALVGRIREHWQAGADHICIQALHAGQSKSTFDGPNTDLLQRLRRSHGRATRRGECRQPPRTGVPG